MSTVNKAIILGRLGADPDVRYTQSNKAVATMNVATNEVWKDKEGNKQEKTDWHRVTAWGRLAEIAQEYLKKGSQIYIEGSIHTREWEDKEGVKRYTTEIKALKLTMLDTRSGNGVPHPAGDDEAPKQQTDQTNLSNFDDLDDDLPF